MSPHETERLVAIVEAERDRSERQLESLRRAVASIVEGAELTATDDEHDPEGATIAYERAQATALLRQAEADVEVLSDLVATLRSGGWPVCAVCGAELSIERLEALPTAQRCVRCAS